MPLPSFYNTGTATIAAGDTAVAGQGTAWQTNGVQAGDLFWAAGFPVRIASVNSNTSLTLAYAWPTTTRTAQSYEIQYVPDLTRVTAANLALLEKLAGSALTALGTLTPAANKLGYFTGAGTAALADFTATGRALAAAASAPAAYDVARTRGADIVAASTLNLDNATGAMVTVTGNTAIDVVTLAAGKERLVLFTGYTSIARTATLIVTNLTGGSNPIVPGDQVLFTGMTGGVVRGIHLPFDQVLPLNNILGDSGRFSASAASATAVGTFAVPGYLTTYNSSTFASEGKFITDNTDYGGAAGALNANVKALVDKIRLSTARRYGVEYWVMRVTAGSGTAGPLVVNGSTYYMAMFNGNRPVFPTVTTHMYVRALTDNIVIGGLAASARHSIDGVPQAPGPIEVTPAMGWVAVETQWQFPPESSIGYATIFQVHHKANGNAALVAAPALVPGYVRFNPKSGVIPNYQAYAA